MNKVDRASQAFGRAIAADNSRADAFAALGLAYDRASQHAYAQRAYTKALELDPERTGTLTNYGLSLALSGNIDGAEKTLKQAAARPDANSQVRQNLALVLGLQGKFEERKTVDATAPAEIMNQNADLIKQMIRRNTAISSVNSQQSIPQQSVSAPVERVKASPTTQVTSADLDDLLFEAPTAAVQQKPTAPKSITRVTNTTAPSTTITRSTPKVITAAKPQSVTVQKPQSQTIAKVEDVIATAPKAPAKPQSETQTARLPGGLRGSLED